MVIWFAVISLLPLAIVTFLNYQSAAKELTRLEFKNLEAISQRQSDEIKSYLRNQERFVSILALNSDVIRSFVVLGRIDEQLQEDKNKILIEEIRKNFSSILKGIMDQFNFHQMFLINLNGDINLSIGADSSHYVNLLEGSLKDTQIAKVFERTLMVLTPQISDFTYSANNKIVCYLAAPVLSEEKLVGIIVLQIDANNIYEVTHHYTGLGNTGETIIGAIVNEDTVILNPTRHFPNINGVFNLSKRGMHDNSLELALQGKRGAGETVDFRGKDVLAAWEYLPNMRWGIVVKADIDEIYKPITDLRFLSICVGVITLVIVLGVAVLVAGSITQPIIVLTNVAERIARGDLTTKIIEGKVPHNEIGLLTAATETMARNLKSLVSQVKASASQVASTTQDVSLNVSEQAASAQETGAASVQITSSARKISATAKELAGTMQEVSDVAEDTALLAESGLDGLLLMQKSMAELSIANSAVSVELDKIQQKAHAISSIISTMTKVTDQSNLLSLNADMEARKAGDAGRGFRVVAKEIRRLADQAAKSTLDIESMIKEMLHALGAGVHAVENLSEKVELGVKEITTVSNHLANVIQQVQGLPPRFEMVLMGMESQSEDAENIKESISHLSNSAQKTMESLQTTNRRLSLLAKTATHLHNEIARFHT